MRRLWVLLLIVCMVLSMTACSNDQNYNGEGQSEDQQVDGDGSGEVQPSGGDQPSVDDLPDVEPPPTEEVQPTEEEQKGNLIPGGYFNNTDPKWGLYMESGGKAAIAVKDGQMEVSAENTGSVKHAVQLYCDGFEMLQNAEYKIAFDIKASVSRTFEWRIQLNGGDYHAYTGEEDIPVTTEMSHFEYTFLMEEASDPAPRFCFNLGYHEPDGELAAHTVYIDNVELIVLDASKADTSASGDIGPSININQVGYRSADTKTAIFRDSSLDTKFDVIDVDTGDIVFTGEVTGSTETASAGEIVAYGDFSSVTDPGTYKITAANSGESYEFVIADDAYEDILTDTVKMLYLQRCGSKLNSEHAGDFAHDACHTQTAIIYGTTDTKDVSGGWHDAGDYGRYVVPGVKAAADLLLAYEDFGNAFSDDLGIPESGNGVPDVLDEVRYELEWMLKMQDDKSGGVYHKVTGLNFAGMVMPETVTDDLYIMPVSNCATGDFAAVMAMAARIYKDYDNTFAERCLDAAKSALAYMESSENNGGFKNPADVLTGEYPDTSDRDEYLWALSELYKTTGEDSYNQKLGALDIASLDSGMGWQAVDIYGCYAYLTADDQDPVVAAKLRDKFNAYINGVEQRIKGDGYFSSVGDVYPWGSNMTLANNGMALLIADKLSDKDGSYTSLAKSQLDYLLGANSTSYCFVTGYGTLTPDDTHHRPSQVLKTTMKGMLVGGANSNLEDPYAQNVLDGKPAAKCYADNSQSYSCNEVTIYWNSPLVYLLAGQQNGK